MDKNRNKTEQYRILRSNLIRQGKDTFKAAKFVCVLAVTLALAVLLVCGDTLAAEKKSAGLKKIRATIDADPVSIDPATLVRPSDRQIAQDIFQGLVTFDFSVVPPYPIIPQLAQTYEVSRDAKMITFKLHKGVKFHHGYGELTSEDVVFTFQRHSDPKVASITKQELADLERVEAPDEYTVRIYLKNPSAFTLLGNLAWQNAGYIVSKKAATKLGDKIQTFPVGTGPFYFDRWQRGEKVVLKRFDQYWKTPPKIDEIEFWIIGEETVGLGALEKGDLDIAKISQAGSYERARTIKGIYIKGPAASAEQNILYINHKMKPMNDVRVRRALAHALDLKDICNRIGPLLKPFPSPIPSAVFAATDEFWPYEYNIDKAKQLLAEAGYPKGFELRLIYKKGKVFEEVALEVQNYWRKIVDVKLELIEVAIFEKRLSEFNHHAALWAMGRVLPYLYAQVYEIGSPRNYMNYSSPEIDAVIKAARASMTEAESRKYYREFQKIACQDVANIWVGGMINLNAIRNGVKFVEFSGGAAILEKADIAE